MKVKEAIDLLSYGVQWQLIGAMTGKKLCNNYSSEKLKSKYMNCNTTTNPIFASFRAHTDYNKIVDSVTPVINIWVALQ